MKTRQKPQNVALSRSDKWKIIAVVAGGIFILIGGAMMGAKGKHSQKIESTLARWRVTYHLDDDQVRKIRGMETQFHAGWNPFNHPAHTPAEIAGHHLAISRMMTSEDAALFLKHRQGEQSATDTPR